MDKEIKSTVPKPFVFVLMPFDKKFNDIYKFGIKGAAEDVEAYAERIDEQIFTEGILDRVFNQINKADIIVADMTGRNANVFYEVGYAHALGKIVLLLTQNADDIPFDLKHRQHIVYGGEIAKLRTELAERLKWAIDESKRQKIIDISKVFLVSVNGTEIPEASLAHDIPIIGFKYYGDLEFIIQNISTETTPRIENIYFFTSDFKIQSKHFNNHGKIEYDDSFIPTNSDDRLIKKFRFKHIIPPLVPGARDDFLMNMSRDLNEIREHIMDELLKLRIHYLDNSYDFIFRVAGPIYRL